MVMVNFICPSIELYKADFHKGRWVTIKWLKTFKLTYYIYHLYITDADAKITYH